MRRPKQVPRMAPANTSSHRVDASRRLASAAAPTGARRAASRHVAYSLLGALADFGRWVPLQARRLLPSAAQQRRPTRSIIQELCNIGQSSKPERKAAALARVAPPLVPCGLHGYNRDRGRVGGRLAEQDDAAVAPGAQAATAGRSQACLVCSCKRAAARKAQNARRTRTRGTVHPALRPSWAVSVFFDSSASKPGGARILSRHFTFQWRGPSLSVARRWGKRDASSRRLACFHSSDLGRRRGVPPSEAQHCCIAILPPALLKR